MARSVAAGLRGVRTEADGRVVPGDIIVAVDGTAVESVKAAHEPP